MKRLLFIIWMLCSFLIFTSPVFAQSTGFEDLLLSSESFWNGSDPSGGFVSNGISFNNNYNAQWASWDGFAYSNLTDTTAMEWDGPAQYTAIVGSGKNSSEIYAIGYVSAFAVAPPTITLDAEQVVSGAYFTNNNYAYYSMKNGDDFSKKFTEGDWFLLTITGIEAQGETTGSVEFKLADGTDIVDTWTWVDLSDLGPVKQLTFAMSSTDNGDFGMNTPSYFAMDNFNNKNSSDDSTCFIQSIVYEK